MEITSSAVRKELLSKYKYKIEMHAHTSPVSACSEVLPLKMAQIYNKLGYDAVVITNHFTPEFIKEMSKKEAIKKYIKDYEDTKIAAEKYNLKIFLGAEVRFSENANDYLLYGVDGGILETVYDYLNRGLAALRKEVKLDRSVLLQAHPFRNRMTLTDTSLLDGIETFNMHPGANSRVGLAVRYADENGLGITAAGSDFHHLDQGHEGVAALRAKILPKDSFAFAELLKSGDYLFEIGGRAIVIP